MAKLNLSSLLRLILPLGLLAACLIISRPAIVSAEVGMSKSQIEKVYGRPFAVQDATGRFWFDAELANAHDFVTVKQSAYRQINGLDSTTLWVEYNNKDIVTKETTILGDNIKIRDFKEHFPALYALATLPDAKAYIISAAPKDQLGLVAPKQDGNLLLIRFFPADPRDRTRINMHTQINGFEITAITAPEVQKHLNSIFPFTWPPSSGQARAEGWIKSDNYFQPELFFSEQLIPRKTTDMIVIHHTYIENMTVEDIHELHLRKGWAGAAYHKVILPDATVKSARPENMIGAHALGANAHSIGIVVVGDFETNRPTAQQMEALINLTLQLMKKYNIELKNVVPHRQVTAGTACPGKLFPWEEFIKTLQNRLN